MRVAIVNQPFSFIDLPSGAVPFSGDSIGLWTYQVATRLAKRWRVLVYTPEDRALVARRTFHGGVEFVAVPVRLERRLMSAASRLRHRSLSRRTGGSNLRVGGAGNGRGGRRRRPSFASPAYYLAYALRIALDVRRRRCDAVVMTNLSQFAPIVRVLNPRVRIALNMECDWLTQLDPEMIDRRLEACDLISGCSAFITERIARAFPRHSGRCFTLYNGTDVDAFTPVEGAPGGRILYVGRVSPEKGVHVLAEAFRELAGRFSDARLSIVGIRQAALPQFLVGVDADPLVRDLARFYRDGANAYQDWLDRALAAAAERVSFLGHRPHLELAAAYRNADVFVCPTVCNEAFGIGVVEAMACGLPVVATRGGGLPELVDHGRTGFLVERGDAGALAAALDTLLRDGALRRSMGAAGRARSLDFSWDGTAARLADRLGDAR